MQEVEQDEGLQALSEEAAAVIGRKLGTRSGGCAPFGFLLDTFPKGGPDFEKRPVGVQGSSRADGSFPTNAGFGCSV